MMSQRDIRLLIIGAMTVVMGIPGAPKGSWRSRVCWSVANNMARGIWAMRARQEDYPYSATVLT